MERLDHADVARALERDAIGYWTVLGSYGHSFRAGIKVESARYAEGVAWLRDLLFGSEFDVARFVNELCGVSGRG